MHVSDRENEVRSEPGTGVDANASEVLVSEPSP